MLSTVAGSKQLPVFDTSILVTGDATLTENQVSVPIANYSVSKEKRSNYDLSFQFTIEQKSGTKYRWKIYTRKRSIALCGL